ncbi:MAG: hypothetical protein R3E01_08680 [Pirellulaceae bacterium]|nr:hypothetical protein [Planctomycetales bacterium]
MTKYSRHQQNIIKNYYDNREAISIQRLQELVTELYLSEGKKRDRNWQLIASHLEKLGVKRERVDHLVAQDKPELIAQVINKMM